MVFWKIIYMKRKKIYILYSLFFLFFRSIYIYAQNKIEENYTLKSQGVFITIEQPKLIRNIRV